MPINHFQDTARQVIRTFSAYGYRAVGAILVFIGFATGLGAQGDPSGHETGFIQGERRDSAMRVADAHYDAFRDSAAIASYLAVVYGPGGQTQVDSLAGLAWHNMAVSARGWRRTDLAVEYYRRAIRVRDAVFTDPHNDRAKSRGNLGGLWLATNQLDSAAHYLYASHELFGQVAKPNYQDWARTLAFLINLAESRNDADTGRSAGELLLNVLQKGRGTISQARRARYYYNAGRQMNELGHYPMAATLVRRAIPEYRAMGDRQRLANAYTVLHAAATNRGELDLAKSYLDSAFLFLPPGPGPVRTVLHADQAWYYLQAGQVNKARAQLREARRYLAPADPVQSYCYQIEGQIAALEARSPAALKALNLALSTVPGTCDSAQIVGLDPSATPYPVRPDSVAAVELSELAIRLAARADFLAEQGRYREALTDYRTLLHLRELERRNLSTAGSRNRLSATVHDELDRAIAVCFDAHREGGHDSLLHTALQFSEWSRAYGLLRGLQEGGFATEDFALQTKLARLQREVVTTPALTAELATTQLEVDRRRQAQASAYQPLGEIDLARLRKLIDEETNVRIYHLGRRGFVFRLPPGGGPPEMREIKTDSLTERVSAYRKALRQSAYRRKSMRPAAEQTRLETEMARLGDVLSDQLLLSDLVGGRHIILPDGSLHALPFAALPVLAGAQLSHAYSLESLAAQHLPAPPPAYDVVAMAPGFAGSDLLPLVGNREEAAGVCADAQRAELLLDTAANRANFRRLGPRARVLHLATHAEANLEHPSLSYLALHQDGSAADAEERIYFNELAAYDLPVELVVLSACETSVGRPVVGETVLNLATGFTSAGARSTLTTLWPVEDDVTQRFMDQFYQQLRSGAGRMEALRFAQESLRTSEDYAHPNYWAGFVLHGAAGPITLERPGRGWWWAVGLGALVFLWFGIRRARSSTRTNG